jgi:hypothetical protein
LDQINELEALLKTWLFLRWRSTNNAFIILVAFTFSLSKHKTKCSGSKEQMIDDR